jgi:hypothetical protein
MFGTTFASQRCAPAFGKEDRAEIPCAACAHSRGAGHACVLFRVVMRRAQLHIGTRAPACEVRASSKAYARNARAPLFGYLQHESGREKSVVNAEKEESA